jgi:hypothetical protein
LIWFQADASGNGGAHRFYVRLEFGPLRHHYRIHIHHLPTPAPHQGGHLLQQQQTVGAKPLGVIGWEIETDITYGEGPEQGIHDRVHQHVGIAMAIQAQAIGVLQPLATQDQWPAWHQSVNVVAIADSQLHRNFHNPL